jgi:hypothetical protein
MVDDFPFFHAVRMLYLKNLAVLDDIRFEKELKKMSIHVPDRKRLYTLINDRGIAGRKNTNKEQPTVSVSKTEDVFDVVDQVLTIPDPPVSPSVAADYSGWLEANREDLPSLDGTENRMKHQELIDSFMENESKQFSQRLGAIAAKEAAKSENEHEISVNNTPEKTSLDDSYFTDTLARVYINQKRYEKALEIIRALNLKYPEKNIYFADQIRYLEKIINIKK